MTEKSDIKKTVAAVLIVLVIVGLIFISDISEIKSFREKIFPPEKPEPVPVSTASDIQLYKFIDLHTNRSLTAEFWLINLGDNVSTDINVFIRARNQDGDILFNSNVTVTSLVLKSNETCSGIYSISYTNITTKIYHTIEINWDSGRHSYQKETLI